DVREGVPAHRARVNRSRPIDDRRVFTAARRVPRERRDAFVAKVCRENEALRLRVEQLLAAAEQPSVFIHPPTGVRQFAADGPSETLGTSRRTRRPALEAGARIADRYR